MESTIIKTTSETQFKAEKDQEEQPIIEEKKQVKPQHNEKKEVDKAKTKLMEDLKSLKL